MTRTYMHPRMFALLGWVIMASPMLGGFLGGLWGIQVARMRAAWALPVGPCVGLLLFGATLISLACRSLALWAGDARTQALRDILTAAAESQAPKE